MVILTEILLLEKNPIKPCKDELLTPTDAFLLLEICERHEIPIIGIEGFRVEVDGITPLLNAIADWSGVEHWKTSIELSKQFIIETALLGDICYEFVFRNSNFVDK